MKSFYCLVLSVCLCLFLAYSATNAESQSAQIKIELDQTGIYQIDYTALQTAGWNVDEVDPHNFALSQRGTSVSFRFIGDEDAQFEEGEAIRFYGWAFDGDERQYVKHNVFWLSADGSGTQIATVEQAHGERVERVAAEITHAPENIFSLTYTRRWPTFDNPFDAWYWALLTKDAAQPALLTLPIDIPHPSPNSTATYLIETLDQKKRDGHVLTPALNGHVAQTTQWDGLINQNISNPISQTLLLNGTNVLSLTLQSEGVDGIYLNRVTVNYERELITNDNSLTFGYPDAGAHTFVVRGITESNPDNLLFWDITNQHVPRAVILNETNLVTSEIGVEHAESAKFLLTHKEKLLQPITLSTYMPQSLEPTTNGAEWLAITHSSLFTETLRLAEQRETHSRLTTHIVTVEEIFAQYGHGLPLPHAIRAYLQHAKTTWEIAPNYVLLVGDASLNPRGLACQGSCLSDWTTADESLIPTFLEPLDRHMGLVPVDHFYTLLEGDDDLPDVAIGRLPVQNSVELAPLIDKIITYEQNLVNPTGWTQDVLFVTDNIDNAGDFCFYSNASAAHWPQQFETTQLCLDETAHVDTLRTAMFERINQGVLVTQYLGHGFVGGWASEGILTADDMPHLQNSDRPFVQISGNCLDGNFAWVGSNSIGETLLQHDLGGTAAHWGAPGLGYLFEHYALHEAFMRGVTQHNLTHIGDAIRYAKTDYLSTDWYYAPQAYTSTLLGDPAMQLFHAELGVEQLVETTTIVPAEYVDIDVQISNRGLLDSDIEIAFDAPSGVEFVAPQLTQTDERSGTLTGNIAAGETLTKTVTVRVIDSEHIGETIAIQTTVTGDGFDGDLADNSAETVLQVVNVDPTTIQLLSLQTRAHQISTVTILVLLLTILSIGSVWFKRQSSD